MRLYAGSRVSLLALVALLGVAAGGCTLLFDPDRVAYVGDAGDRLDSGQGDAGQGDAGQSDAGQGDSGQGDAGPRDAGPDSGPDAEIVDSGPPACGQLGEACCAAPSPACTTGANCTLEGCQPCGGPGEACCDDGAACRTLTCLTALDRCPAITPLVQVAVPAGGTYGIDAHEVTREQYEGWLATSPVAAGALIGPGCAWNTTFTPNATCVAAGFDCSGAACAGRPQTCVDWCDAYAYCAAVGKQLCGRYGGDSGLPTSSFSDANASPWYNACSSGGMFQFPTGDSGADADDHCNFTDMGASVDADSLTDCQSSVPGYEGVLALTGNVREWLNGCSHPTDMTASCLAVGGAYLDNDWYEGQCNYPNTHARNNANASTGLRCCEIRP